MYNTYCAQTSCIHIDCGRHQHNAPTDRCISIADFNDGWCFDTAGDELYINNHEKLLAAICKGTQNTSYACNDACKAMCGVDGTCQFCSAIADTIEKEFRKLGWR